MKIEKTRLLTSTDLKIILQRLEANLKDNDKCNKKWTAIINTI